VVIDECFLVFFAHAIEWVESTSEVTLESLASFDDLSHDLVSLGLGNSWTEWEAIEVSSNSDSSGDNHSGVFWGEVSVGNTLGGHVRGVGVFGLVTVIVLDNLVEKLVELGVRVMGAGIKADSGVEVLNTGEDHCLECNSLSA
jgi:hypothetical protein